MSLIKRNGWNLSLECEENQYNRHERHARCEAVEEEVGEPVRAVTDAVKAVELERAARPLLHQKDSEGGREDREREGGWRTR